MKTIISAIQLLDDTSITRIAKGKYANLKARIKLPMILMSFVAGLIGGLQGSLMRGMTISVEIDGLFSGITFCYLLLAVLAAVL